jgi:hypothetical protein
VSYSRARWDSVYRTEYLTFEFTDGYVLDLLIGSGNSFAVGDGSEIERAKRTHRKEL